MPESDPIKENCPETHESDRRRLTGEEALKRWEERAQNHAKRPKKLRRSSAEVQAIREANAQRARAVLMLKREERDLVREKVKKGMPITEEERKKLHWRSNRSERTEQSIDEMASKLEIKPSTANQLRLVIEKTAARHKYNPIEGLILAINDPDVEMKDKIAIHKALLPYLAPQLSPLKQKEEDPTGSGKVSVRVTQFVFQSKKPEAPIHEQAKPIISVDTPPSIQP